MLRPTTYEGWLELVKEADTLGHSALFGFLVVKGIDPPFTLLALLRDACAHIYGHGISERQQAYARVLYEHFLSQQITVEQWLDWLHADNGPDNFLQAVELIFKKTGYDLSEFENLAQVLGNLKLTLKEGQSL